MDKIRIGVVGLGHRGRYMCHLIMESFDCNTLVAACDIDPELWSKAQWHESKPMAEIFPETKFYEDYTKMLDENKLDIVFVETGADVHANFCIQALSRDYSVFSDIPSVATLEEADKLWKAKEASKGHFMTGANPNYWGFIAALVDLYKKGILGEPYYMEAEYIHATRPGSEESVELVKHSPWRKTLPPIRYCTHSLGPLLRIMSEDLRYTACFGTGPHVDPNGLRDDMMSALFRTESGVTIRILRNGPCRAYFGHHSFRVFGTKGYFERIDQRGATPPVTRFSSLDFYGAPTLTELPVNTMPVECMGNPKAVGHGGVDYAMLNDMFTAFQNNAPDFPITLREGLRMTLPGIYAAESARRGGTLLRMTYPWDSDWSTAL